MEIEDEGRYGQGRNPENIYVKRSKMNTTNLVSSFALGSILSFTAQYTILRALKRQLRRSRLAFSKKSHPLWSDSRCMGAVDGGLAPSQMRCLATIREMDGETSTIQYITSHFDQSRGQKPSYASSLPYHPHVYLVRCTSSLPPPSQFCRQVRRIKY
jgi:hypothetical protein